MHTRTKNTHLIPDTQKMTQRVIDDFLQRNGTTSKQSTITEAEAGKKSVSFDVTMNKQGLEKAAAE